jgi:hypothetical protein
MAAARCTVECLRALRTVTRMPSSMASTRKSACECRAHPAMPVGLYARSRAVHRACKGSLGLSVTIPSASEPAHLPVIPYSSPAARHGRQSRLPHSVSVGSVAHLLMFLSKAGASTPAASNPWVFSPRASPLLRTYKRGPLVGDGSH